MTVKIYVQLLDEGTPTYRPTEGEPVGGNKFKILPTPRYDPEDEVWEFLPGSAVECSWEVKRDGSILLAKRLANPE